MRLRLWSVSFFLFGVRALACDYGTVQFSCDKSIALEVGGVCTVSRPALADCAGTYSMTWGVDHSGDVSLISVYPALSCHASGSTTPNMTPIAAGVTCEGDAIVHQGENAVMTVRITPHVAPQSPDEFRALYENYYTSFDGNLGLSWSGSLPIPLSSCTVTPKSPGATASGADYTVSWVATSGSVYEVEEATKPDFSDATSITVQGPVIVRNHTVGTTTTYYYRVRVVACQTSTFGPVTQTVVIASQPPASKSFDIIVPIDNARPVTQTIRLTGFTPGTVFFGSSDQAFVTVAPASGQVSSDGSVTITATAQTTGLSVGANTATISIKTGSGKGALGSDDATSSSVPLSVSVVTPVIPQPKTSSSGDAILIPGVAHLAGAGTSFQSDIRLTNTNSSAVTYTLTFTPQNSDGTTTGRQTSMTVQPDQTVALNDVLRDFFGFALPSDSAGGVLEVRTATAGAIAKTYVSSRTYATGSTGTFGQFIPGTLLSKFLKSGAGSLTLSQVSQSSAFRTNIGIFEGLGIASTGVLRVFDNIGTSLGEFPYSLRPFEFQQLGGFLGTKGINNVGVARVEVVNNSPGSGVSTYASVLDNKTNDPLLASPVSTASLAATRYVLPGMADLDNGVSNFHSEIRIYNAASFPVGATVTFYPQGNLAGAVSQQIIINGNEIKSYDNVLPTLFNVHNAGGSILITTSSATQLVVSGRTYSNDGQGGTYGQFIPAVTPADGIGAGDPPLQVLQLEQSKDFRSNLGLAELTGNPATVEVQAIFPGSKVTLATPVELQGNEFKQLNGLLAGLVSGSAYNARVTVRVIAGTGRVTAYGSVIDNNSKDPTYVPAQK